MNFRPIFAILPLIFLSACKDEPPPQRLPPPPAAPPSTCEGGGGTLEDPETAPFFPRKTGDFCLDPHGSAKTYGEGAQKPIDRICDLFDGECEVYRRFGVKRVVELRYVHGGGTPATLDVYISKFASSEGAYAMFTQRVVGDGDPADEATPRPVEAPGVAALGLGNAYLWRGPYLVEMTYNDQTASETSVRKAADALLPPLLKEVGAHVLGDTTPPPAVAMLPVEDRLPLGVRVLLDQLASLKGVGGAYGYYRLGEKRYRVAAIPKTDVDQAKDILATLGKMPGASSEKVGGEPVVRLMMGEGEGVKGEWLFAVSKAGVVGVGDEVRLLRAGMPAQELANITLTRDEKTERLKNLRAAP